MSFRYARPLLCAALDSLRALCGWQHALAEEFVEKSNRLVTKWQTAVGKIKSKLGVVARMKNLSAAVAAGPAAS